MLLAGPLWRQLAAKYGASALDFVGSQQNGPADIDRDHEGHPGWTLGEVDKIRSSWAPLAPDIVLLHLATNDFGQQGIVGHNISHANASLASLLGHIREASPAATVLLTSLINAPEYYGQAQHAEWNAMLPALSSSWTKLGLDVRFVDMVGEAGGLCEKGNSSCCPLMIHPTDAGYATMADVWFAHLAPVVDERLRPQRDDAA